jgi:uncharacterized protein (TIGR00251 family)
MMRVVEKEGAVRFEVYAKPKAKKSRVVGERGDAVEVAIAAPPVEGAANEELIRFLASLLGVRKRDITLLRGETSHTKLLEVTSITPDELRARLWSPQD